jgi:rhamnosyltransferase
VQGVVAHLGSILLPAFPAPDVPPTEPSPLGVGQRPERVGAVIVTYFADPATVGRLVAAVAPQVEFMTVIDNTPADRAERPTAVGLHRVDWHANGANLGLAIALNQGIDRVARQGGTHVVLFDQDSMPTPDLVERLLDALRRLTAEGARVAAVGPTWRDRHSGRNVPFVRLGWGRMRTAGRGAVVECDTLVSSGCLIPLAVIEEVGPMDARLFIDQVDTEWGLRAQRRGYRLFGVHAAELTHGIGEAFVQPWFARGRAVPVHAPVRDYYLVRNTIEVFFRRRAPWRWRLLQAWRLPALILVLLTQMPQRAARLRYVVRAVADGVCGRLGPAPSVPAARRR